MKEAYSETLLHKPTSAYSSSTYPFHKRAAKHFNSYETMEEEKKLNGNFCNSHMQQIGLSKILLQNIEK